MELLVALVSLISIFNCALGAVFGQQELFFKHFGGRYDGLICGKSLALKVTNSNFSAKVELRLDEIGNNFEYGISGRAAIAIIPEKRNVTHWLLENSPVKPKLGSGDVVLLVVENDAACLANMFEFVTAAFVDGSIQQNVIDSNDFFSIAAYKVFSKNESQPESYVRPIKLLNDEHNYDVSFTDSSSHEYEPFILECISGWNGEKPFIMGPRSVSLAIDGFEEDPPSVFEFKIKGSKLTVSGSGFAMALLVRNGKKHTVLPAKDRFDWDVEAEDIVLFNVWNRGANGHEMAKLTSTAIIEGAINKKVFAMGNNHVIMAFKVNRREMLFYKDDEEPVEALNYRNEFGVAFSDDNPLIVELIGGNSSEGLLEVSPDYASLMLPVLFNVPGKAQMTLRDGNPRFFVAGNALIFLYRKGQLNHIIRPQGLPQNLGVEVGDIIQLVAWKQNIAIEQMIESVINAVDIDETDCGAFKIISLRVAVGEKQRNGSKREREEEDQMMEGVGFRPTKFYAVVPLRLAVVKMSDDFPEIYELRNTSFRVDVAPNSECSNFANIRIVKENKMQAALKNNAYLFVIRGDEIIYWILPGEYCEISGSLKEQDTVAIFIHNSASKSDKVEIEAGNPLLNRTFNNLLIAGYEYLILEAR